MIPTERANLRLECFKTTAGYASPQNTSKEITFGERQILADDLFEWCIKEGEK